MLYVDKTRQIHELIVSGKYYFLSRPRRFGKSLTLSTIKEIFLGSQSLFEGLWIANQWNWEKKHPVLHASFSNIGYQQIGLEKALSLMLDRWAKVFGLTLQDEGITLRFREIIQKVAERGERVVLLIDEYDKPLIDYLTKPEQARENQQILKAFYSIIKESDPYLQMVLITGVSKFSKVGVFSDLNNLKDITLDWRFADLTGYTQKEVENNFADHLQFISHRLDKTGKEILKQLKSWYNGYTWDGDVYVYNPFSVLNFFQEGVFRNFWFETGTPTFLINLLKERMYYDFSKVPAGSSTFNSYHIENLETVPLLFQTGYLTIKHIDEFGIYTLGYPNREVEDSMLQHLIGAFSYRQITDSAPTVVQLRHAFVHNDLEQVRKIINSLFKNIPSHIFIADKEAYYHSVVFLVFYYLGLFIDVEVHTSDGRADAVVYTPTHIYLLEFKLDAGAQPALDQIHEKKYADKFATSGKTIVLIGINFDSRTKSVGDWLVEEVKD